ncbi:MAG TPA: SMR family transporter [Pseudogracilibacillus sp.]|nr:SMR family transporter [Pseudogracilibacillus sp.]
MGWIYVLFAAIVEVFWVLGLKFSDSILMWSVTIGFIVFSFYFVIKACELLPSGTVYATFTGSGAAAIAIIDFIFLDTPFTFGAGFCILLIITGVVGLQLTTAEE